ncbi:MAG: hypothetical protein KatS3mg110_3233 [Pirellulaceae bacterium]|nr:MAG: hypothetical protein KatS3mg110_3233 [Pirellulaceae bacterium]
MGRKRKVHTAAGKARGALAAVRGQGTLSELAPRFQADPVQIAKWRRQLPTQAAEVFGAAGRASVVSKSSWSPNCTGRLGGYRWNWNG